MGDLATLPTFQPAPTQYTHSDFNAAFAALTIANSAVTTNKLANQSVTFAKMQDVPTSTLIGRSTASTGSPESITIGTSLSLSGGTLNTAQDIRTTASPTFAGLTSPIGQVTALAGYFTDLRSTDGTTTGRLFASAGTVFIGSSTNHSLSIIVNGGQVGAITANGLNAFPIGQTSAAAGTFTNLVATGTLGVNSTSQLLANFQSTAVDPYLRITANGATVQGFLQALDAGGVAVGSITNHAVVVRANNTDVAGFYALTGITIIPTNGYCNFGAGGSGSGGYGFRDSGGTMQFKNSGGSWQAFGTGGGSGTVTSVGISGSNGIGVSGSPITGSGTITISLGAITPSSVASSGTVSGTIADFTTEYRVGGTKVVGSRGSSITTFGPTGTYSSDMGNIATAINTIISRMQAHGLIS